MQHLAIYIVAANWMEWVFPVIVFILYTLGQLMSARGNKAKKPPRVPKPRDPAAPPQKPRTLEEKLRGEVEDFLRQVRGDQPEAEEPSPVVVAQRPVVVKVEQAPRRIVELEKPRESIQESVAKHMSTADITQNAHTLGADIDQADERMVAHLQQTFQHQLGSLEPKQIQPRPIKRQNKSAAEIAELLRSPKGMRQAIMLSEILRRPEI